MPVNFVWSCPPDPETDLKNFQREQAKYESAYRRTGDPLALFEAILNAGGLCASHEGRRRSGCAGQVWRASR